MSSSIKKWLHFLFVIIFLVLLTLSLVIGSLESNRVQEASARLVVSQVSVCTMEGKSVSKQDDPSLYIIPNGMERIFICGWLQTSYPFDITIYLYRRGVDRAFYAETSRKLLQTGPFIIDLIATDDLKGGEYRADLHIMKEVRSSVPFIVEK